MPNAPAPNPFATPEASISVECDHDRFIREQSSTMLEDGERLLHTAYLVKAPPLMVQLLLMGGLIMLLFVRHYLAAVTNRRIILMRTRNYLLKPQLQNRGVEEIRWSNVDRIDVGGLANNRSLKFRFKDGSFRTLRIAPWAKFVSGQKAFLELAKGFEPGVLS